METINIKGKEILIIDILRQYGDIDFFYKTKYITLNNVAKYFNVGLSTIKSVLYRNKDILEKTVLISPREVDIIISEKISNRGVRLFSLEGIISIANILTSNVISENIRKDIFGEIYLSRIRKEISFLEQLEEVLSPLDIKGRRQYNILGYRIDYYIESLNLAIEYDEDDHRNYTYENQEERQAIIEKELDCKFIRLSDSNTDLYNIGIVMREIINIKNK